MARPDIPCIRPKFDVNEAKLLLSILRAALLSPEDLEAAMFRERLQRSLVQFLAVNGEYKSGVDEVPDFEAIERQLAEFAKTLPNQGRE